MHILISTFSFPPETNGVSHVAYEHAVGLLKLGHKITVVTAFNDQRNSADLPSNMTVVQFKITGNANFRSRYRGEISKYIDFISSFDGDIICCHCWQIWNTDLAVRGFGNTRAKKILVSHGVSANSLIKGIKSIPSWILWKPYLLWDMPRMMFSFDHIVFLSNKNDKDRFYDRNLAEKLGYSKFSIIPNGCNWKQFFDTPQDFKQQFNINDKLMILCVGDYSLLKNEKMVLEAFIGAELDDVCLVFIGNKKNKYSEKLRKIWSKANTKKTSQVLLLENLSQLQIIAAYKSADIFVCGSKSECFPLVILDAMASSTPFISTDVGCISTLPGGTVAKDCKDMTAKLKYLVENAEERSRLSLNGIEACKGEFQWNNIISKYDILFKSVANI